MSSRTLRLLATALLLLAAVFALLAWHASRTSTPPSTENAAASTTTYPVVVTTRQVEAGAPLSRDVLKLERLPIEPTGAFDSIDAVSGRAPVVTLGANVPVLQSQLSGGLASQVPEGHRAVAIAVDEVVGVGHRLRPGDLVDVVLVLRRDSQEISGSQARLLMSRLRVLAYGSQAVNDTRDASSDSTMGRREGGAKTAVLSVPLAQVSTLAMAQQAGRLTLALRNPDDSSPSTDETSTNDPAGATEQPGASTVRLAALAGTPTARDKVVLPSASTAGGRAERKPPATIEIIRAGKREAE